MVGSDDFMGEASIELSDLNLDRYVLCGLLQSQRFWGFYPLKFLELFKKSIYEFFQCRKF